MLPTEAAPICMLHEFQFNLPKFNNLSSYSLKTGRLEKLFISPFKYASRQGRLCLGYHFP